MNKYTVIGYYSEDNQTTADAIEAETGEEALRKCALERLGEYDKEEDFYHDQDQFELVVAILIGGDGAEPGGLTFPSDGGGMVEARDYVEPEWRFEKTEGQDDA